LLIYPKADLTYYF